MLLRKGTEVYGLVVPLLTPLKDDLSVDSVALKNHTARLLNRGVKNFFALGSTGEFNSLVERQERRVIEVVSDTVGSHGVVLAGCFASSTDEIISKVKFAQRHADYCVINVPLGALTNEFHFIDFFEE